MTRQDAGGSGAWHEQLDETLETVSDLYQQLGALSRRLISGIENGEVDELLDLLEERSGCIERLEGISHDYESGLAAFERSSSTLATARRDELSARVTTIQQNAAALADSDARAAGLLEKHRRAIASEMSAMSQKSAAVAAYSGGRDTTPPARFQDREG